MEVAQLFIAFMSILCFCLSIAVNAVGSVWTTKYLQTTSSIAASGAGSLYGQALYLASGVVQPTWAASKAQLYFDSATQELRHRFNNVNYSLAGVNVLKTARFDGTLSQTLYNDGVILFNWDGPSKQVRLQIAATPWFSAKVRACVHCRGPRQWRVCDYFQLWAVIAPESRRCGSVYPIYAIGGSHLPYIPAGDKCRSHRYDTPH